MFYFAGSRKPDFKNTSLKKSIFDDYWQMNGYGLRNKLMDREEIFFDWISAGSKVLSIGCGNSRLPYELIQKKQCFVFAIDLAESVIETQQKQGVKAYRVDVGNPVDFGKIFGDEHIKFDYVIMGELLQQLRLPEELLHNLEGHAQYLAISIPNSAFYRYRIGLFFGGHFFTQWNNHPAETLRYWSHKDFMDWLSALGWKIVKSKASNGLSLGFLQLYNWWPNMFGHQICYLVRQKSKI